MPAGLPLHLAIYTLADENDLRQFATSSSLWPSMNDLHSTDTDLPTAHGAWLDRPHSGLPVCQAVAPINGTSQAVHAKSYLNSLNTGLSGSGRST